MANRFLPILFIGFFVSIVGCDGEDGEVTHATSDAGADTDAQAEADNTFSCRNDDCDSSSEFCILSILGDGPSTDNQTCGTLPTACDDCECAKAVAESEWLRNEGSGNCTDRTIDCSKSNGEITVTCASRF